MQTLIVHNNSWRELLTDLGWFGFLGFQIYVGSMVLSAPLHTAFMLSLVLSFATGGVAQPLNLLDLVAAVTFIIGYAGPALLVVMGLRRLQRRDLLIRQLALPLYWVLHSVAAMLALIELVRMPHFWAKTEHGQTQFARGSRADRAPVQAE